MRYDNDKAKTVFPQIQSARSAMMGAVVLAVLIVVLWMIRPGARLSDTVTDCARLQRHTEQSGCLAALSGDLYRRPGGAREVLRALAGLVQSGVIDDCHRLAHDLGHVAFETGGELLVVMREGDASCLKGYYHGVVEGAVQRAASIGRLDIANLCTGLDEESPAHDGCLHGLGHGVMHQFRDVPSAMQLCASLDDTHARHRCVEGIFMENAMRFLPLADAEYRSRAPRACEGLSLLAAERDLCHEEIGETAMFYYRHDLSLALSLCKEVGSGPGINACERGARHEFDLRRREHRIH